MPAAAGLVQRRAPDWLAPARRTTEHHLLHARIRAPPDFTPSVWWTTTNKPAPAACHHPHHAGRHRLPPATAALPAAAGRRALHRRRRRAPWSSFILAARLRRDCRASSFTAFKFRLVVGSRSPQPPSYRRRLHQLAPLVRTRVRSASSTTSRWSARFKLFFSSSSTQPARTPFARSFQATGFFSAFQPGRTLPADRRQRLHQHDRRRRCRASSRPPSSTACIGQPVPDASTQPPPGPLGNVAGWSIGPPAGTSCARSARPCSRSPPTGRCARCCRPSWRRPGACSAPSTPRWASPTRRRVRRVPGRRDQRRAVGGDRPAAAPARPARRDAARPASGPARRHPGPPASAGGRPRIRS